MPVTRPLCAAYNGRMETMLLLVLLMMNADEQTQETLKSFLRFYRENRELIQTFAQGDMKAAPAHFDDRPAEEQRESRPRSEAGNAAILEEYLKRFTN